MSIVKQMSNGNKYKYVCILYFNAIITRSKEKKTIKEYSDQRNLQEIKSTVL